MKPPELLPATPLFIHRATEQLDTYADFLATVGVERGLIGPREVDRLWPRHLLNCAAVVDPAAGLIPESASVLDIGSGAGLPGVVWAIVRPDLRIEMVEPMQRRVEFLAEVLELLGLSDQVRVIRARAQDLPAGTSADIVTARAVAPLTKLAVMLLQLVQPGGSMVALKGTSAGAEVAGARTELKRLGAGPIRVETCGADWLEAPTTVVVAERLAAKGPKPKKRKGQRRAGQV